MAGDAGSDGAVVCAVCGAVPTDGAGLLTWSRDGTRNLCPACTRRHVRDIEARLDPEWWS